MTDVVRNRETASSFSSDPDMYVHYAQDWLAYPPLSQSIHHREIYFMAYWPVFRVKCQCTPRPYPPRSYFLPRPTRDPSFRC